MFGIERIENAISQAVINGKKLDDFSELHKVRTCCIETQISNLKDEFTELRRAIVKLLDYYQSAEYLNFINQDSRLNPRSKASKSVRAKLAKKKARVQH